MADYKDSIEFHVVYGELVQAARYGGFTTYQRLATLIGLKTSGQHMGTELGKVLELVENSEHEALRPMLTSVCVGTSGKPGPGFYKLAEALGYVPGRTTAERDLFWTKHVSDVYQRWKPRFPQE